MQGARPPGLPESVYVHPLSLVETAEIGAQTRIWGFTHVMKGAVVGERCNLCEHVYVEAGAKVGSGVTIKNGISLWDQVTIEDDVFLGPHAVFTNDLRPRAFVKKGPEALVPTLVRQGATIGGGATIVCGVTIGRYAFVAAGAVVTRDVPDFALVKGNPARVDGWVCKCLETRFPKSGGPTSCPKCKSARPV